MKILCYLAASVDGRIADENGGEDFLSETHWEGFMKLVREHGAYVMGSRARDAIKDWGGTYFADLEGFPGFIISQDLPPAVAMERLREQGFESAVLTGGATTVSSFVDAGLIDELLVSVEPVLLGAGVPLVRAIREPARLRLLGAKHGEHDTVQLHYAFA